MTNDVYDGPGWRLLQKAASYMSAYDRRATIPSALSFSQLS